MRQIYKINKSRKMFMKLASMITFKDRKKWIFEMLAKS